MRNLDMYLKGVLDNYFNIVEQTGYVSKYDVDKILVLIGIKDLLYLYFEDIINLTSEEIKTLTMVVSSIVGMSCIFPHMIPDFKF